MKTIGTLLVFFTLFLPNSFAQNFPHTILRGHTDGVYSVAFSPDGTTLASAGNEDQTIRLWGVHTGQHQITLRGGSDYFRTVAFSPDGGVVAGGSDESTIWLWNVVTGQHITTLRGHTGGVWSVAFSPNGEVLASGSDDNTIRLWDAVTGRHITTLTGHTEDVDAVAFSPNGEVLASGSDDDTIRLWDAVTGRHITTLLGHTNDIAVGALAFSPNGEVLASGSDDDTIRLWDAVTGQHITTLRGHTGGVWTVAFSPDGRILASGSGDNTIRLWHLTDTRVSITPSSVESPAIGQQLTINVDVIKGENVGGYQVTVGFDPTALRYVESSNGDYLQQAFFVPPVVSDDEVTLGAVSRAGVSNGDGTLADVTFEVVDVKRSSLTFSQALLTDSDGKYLHLVSNVAEIIEPAATPSSAVISVTPSSMLSPAIRQQLVFNVDITGGRNVVASQLTWEFDSTALELISSSQGDYLADGARNRIGRLMTGTFVVRTVKTSTVSLSGYLIRSNGFRYIPTFESAAIIAPLLGDVNRDGVVDILDLVLVGSSFTQRVPDEGNPADVNESGVVDIVDLVLVAGALGNAAAAPSTHLQTMATLTAANVQQWLTQAQGLALTDATSQRGILFLEQLLAALTPEDTTLLPNYPNPFNPETWIPYELAHAADVTLTIYDTKGAMVRQLDLGYQPAGYYTTRSKAAYWDGHNASGESVASGVYFYQLRVSSVQSIGAGDYSKTRRMVILK